MFKLIRSYPENLNELPKDVKRVAQDSFAFIANYPGMGLKVKFTDDVVTYTFEEDEGTCGKFWINTKHTRFPAKLSKRGFLRTWRNPPLTEF